MQCGELVYRKVTIMTQGSDSVDNRQKKPEKESIHSGHFMVSHFEAEAEDDECDVAVPIPNEDAKFVAEPSSFNHVEKNTQQVSIETSLTKLFQCMSLAYRQKLTSPRWNRFKGIRLRWKDKIRLNNVIWRCWHMQFIMKQNTMVCQFASPLDVDTHNKPEAVVLEGKYWKRRLAALSAEYKKWRMFHRNRILGWSSKDSPDTLQTDMDMFDWQPHSNDSNSMNSMMVDEDYMEFMSDTLFSTIQSNQPFAFPDPREIARGAGLADFIQPSLVQLQPNLDDFMDTLEPLQDLVSLSHSMKLPSVPEECVVDEIYRSSRSNAVAAFPEILDNQTTTTTTLQVQLSQHQKQQQQHQQLQQQIQQQIQPQQLPQQQQQQQQQTQQNLQYTATIFAQPEVSSSFPTATNLITRPPDFAQGSVNVTYDEVASVTGSVPARPVPPAMSLDRRISRPVQKSPENRVLVSQRQQGQQQQQPQHQQQQQQQQQQQADLFQSQQIAQQTILMTQPRTQPQTNQNNVNSYQQVPSTRLSPSSVQQSQPFPGQQDAFISTPQPPPPPQVSGYKYPTSSPPTLPTAAGDPSLNASVPPPRRQNVRSNSLTSEDDFFAVPKYNKSKLQMRKTVSGSSLATSTTQRQHPPPLVSTNSDPNLPTVSSSTLQPLLAQLLSTSNANNGVFNFTGSSDRFKSSQVVPILPMPPQGINNTASSGASQASLPQSTTALLITTPVTMTSVAPLSSSGTTQPPSGNHVLLNTFPASRKPTYSPDSSSSSMGVGLCSLLPSLNMPTMAPPKPVCVRPDSASQRIRRPDSTPPKQEHRRECHTKAEHKRRCNIKNGFDMLHSLIPQLHQNPNAKLSKAAMLQKGADYIQQLRAERDQLRDEMQSLKHEIECLNQSISNCQSMLPATGAPVSRQRASKLREMFDEYVRMRTLENWKFWIFSILIEPLLTSYNSSVSTASFEDLYRSTLNWVEQHCSLVDLRPAVLNSLRYLSTATEILTDPSKLPDEAHRAVLKQDHQH